MARGQRRTLEDKISEKQELIESLQIRIESEKNELEGLYKEKKIKDLEIIDELIKSSGLSEYEVTEALESYTRLKNQKVS